MKVAVEIPAGLRGYTVVKRLERSGGELVQSDGERWVVAIETEKGPDEILALVRGWLGHEDLAEVAVEIAGARYTIEA
jgi:hypothetical protein